MKFFTLAISLLFITIFGYTQALVPYTTCPDVTIAITRAGTNADITNPYFLYNVNQSSGVMTQVAGAGYKDPSSPASNIQINAVGVNKKDGFIYGLVYDGTVTTARFVRLDKNYGVTSFGNIAPPVSPTGPLSFVNSAAGEMDTSGNYYFTASTAMSTNPSPTLDKFFIGKISNVAALTVGPPAVTYYEIVLTGANCSGYVNTLTLDPSNSGLKDFSYNAFTKTFFTYVTFKPTGAANFSGQLMELTPIAGSNPLKYQMVCNPVINTHTAEVSGTLIDKLGRFTVSFTDGSFGMLNKNSSGNYDGSYTQIALSAVTGLPNPSRGDMASCGQQLFPGPPSNPFTTCPDVNIAVLRAGFNADTLNPYNIYTVNTTTGAVTLLPGGPLVYPANPAINLQVNGVGINKIDGYLYGLVYEGTVSTAKFVRFDKNYGVTLFGDIAPPTSPTGLLGFVNSAAGDVDRLNNYYFTGNTANPGGPTGYLIDKLFLGKISNISSMSGTPTPIYSEIDYTDLNCSAYVTSLNADPNNSGLKDFSYSPFTSTFFTYATYKNAGATTFSGQVIELRPIAGSSPLKYKMFCNPVINTTNAETSGTLIDKAGNFEVLFTDGTLGKLQSGANPYSYTGVLLPLNSNTGLPSVLRGDMASCGDVSATPLALNLASFNARAADGCKVLFNWQLSSQGVQSIQLEQSSDNNTFTLSSNIPVQFNDNNYSYFLPALGVNNYRLKVTDNSSGIIYSSIVHVNSNCDKNTPGFIISPNPVTGTLYLIWYGIRTPSSYVMNIYNAYGILVSSSTEEVTSGATTRIDLSKLAKGTYVIKGINGRDQSILKEKFVKF